MLCQFPTNIWLPRPTGSPSIYIRMARLRKGFYKNVIISNFNEMHVGLKKTKLYLGNEALSLSRYSPRAFCILPSKSASLSNCLCTFGIFTTSITRGYLATFFIKARNSVLTLKSNNPINQSINLSINQSINQSILFV